MSLTQKRSNNFQKNLAYSFVWARYIFVTKKFDRPLFWDSEDQRIPLQAGAKAEHFVEALTKEINIAAGKSR